MSEDEKIKMLKERDEVEKIPISKKEFFTIFIFHILAEDCADLKSEEYCIPRIKSCGREVDFYEI